jgi:multidrug efflux system membrane fusion protein
VYVVKQDKSVESRNIRVALTEGTVAVLDSGVKPGELVITDGQEKLQPGNRVEVERTGPPGKINPPDQVMGANSAS